MSPDRHSPVLHCLARLYAESKAGRTGTGERDFLVDLKKLLTEAGCQDGDARHAAMRQLRELDSCVVQLEGPRRDLDIVHTVRLPLANESKLFQLLGTPSPTSRREALSRQFRDAAALAVPHRWVEPWRRVCSELAEAALQGIPIAPFSRDDLEGNAELLALVARLLDWQQGGQESLLRFASCVLTGSSKRLAELAAENAAGRRAGRVGAILERVTGGVWTCLEDIGIVQSPRFVLLHGPLRLQLDGGWLDLGVLRGPVRLADADVDRASQIDTTSPRCLTVENETTFHELARLGSGELLVCTSYPGSATLALLRKLPAELAWWHFGDTDPEGFEILRDLRERSGRPFRALHMNYRGAACGQPHTLKDRRLLEKLLALACMEPEREVLQEMMKAGNKGRFEQESLGKPQLSGWPFYS